MGLSLGGVGKALGVVNPSMALGAVTTFGDSLIQSYANRSAAQKANKYAYTAWQLQNDYNTPLEQRKRLEDAGYNPNLWYTNGNTGNAGTLATSGYQPADWSVGKNALNGLAQYQQIEAQRASIANTQANTELARYNAVNADVQSQILRHNLTYAQDHNLPVGQLETYPSRVLDDVSKPGGILGRVADKVEKYMNREGTLGNRFFSGIGDFLWRMNSMEERRRSKR